MEPTYKNCQSCGMPLKKSPNGGGSNADGSISKAYCSYCFVMGKFNTAHHNGHGRTREPPTFHFDTS